MKKIFFQERFNWTEYSRQNKMIKSNLCDFIMIIVKVLVCYLSD